MKTHKLYLESSFSGTKGRLLAGLLQIGFVRTHRVQKGLSETPLYYNDFLDEVVWTRILATAGKICVFGAGTHTDISFKAMPGFAERVHCITDNNDTLWHQTLFEKQVLPPTDAVKCCDVFYLSTALYQSIFRADLKRLGFNGTVIAVDDHVPPIWFL